MIAIEDDGNNMTASCCLPAHALQKQKHASSDKMLDVAYRFDSPLYVLPLKDGKSLTPLSYASYPVAILFQHH